MIVVFPYHTHLLFVSPAKHGRHIGIMSTSSSPCHIFDRGTIDMKHIKQDFSLKPWVRPLGGLRG